jgi:hypothetical protein
MHAVQDGLVGECIQADHHLALWIYFSLVRTYAYHTGELFRGMIWVLHEDLADIKAENPWVAPFRHLGGQPQ